MPPFSDAIYARAESEIGVCLVGPPSVLFNLSSPPVIAAIPPPNSMNINRLPKLFEVSTGVEEVGAPIEDGVAFFLLKLMLTDL